MMTRQDVIGLIGPADDALVAKIIGTGASPDELAQAWAWLNSDEAQLNEGRHLPEGNTAILIDLLANDEIEEDDISASRLKPGA